MSKTLELHWPIKPVNITQRFGANQPCVRYFGTPEQRVIESNADGTCPILSDKLYQHFGLKGHNGMDLAAYHGQPVRAAHAGTVVYAGYENSEGAGVVLRTNEPFDYWDTAVYFKTVYWHLIPQIPVKVGQRIGVGDIIGFADNTGASSGDHLHFALKPQRQGIAPWTFYNLEEGNGYLGAIDNEPYMSKYTAEDAQRILGWFTDILIKMRFYLSQYAAR